MGEQMITKGLEVWTLQTLVNVSIMPGQMTILMHQADFKVPGVYSPPLEEWSNYGAPSPEL